MGIATGIVQPYDVPPTVGAPSGSGITVNGNAITVNTSAHNYTFAATNPEGGALKYDITWGGGSPSTNTQTVVANGTFTPIAHTYSAGTYSLVVKVTDIQGSVKTRTFTVTAS